MKVKVKCDDCKNYKKAKLAIIFDSARFHFNQSFLNRENPEKPQLAIRCEPENGMVNYAPLYAINECYYFKRKWWKFWVS